MKYTGAQIVIKMLEGLGIKVISGIPGGSNLPLYAALEQSTIHHILARHEQSAGFIAQGMARTSGETAVCFATSGPGATNLLTAIADAKLDSIPIVAITGQVPTAMIGTDAFQEVDTYGLSCPITKHCYLVKDAGDLLTVIPEAFRIASEGRPGPVLIDIPKDVQLQTIEVAALEDHLLQAAATDKSDRELETTAESKSIQKAAQMINTAKRPVFYIGGGIMASNAGNEIQQIAEKATIPVTLTLMGLGVFPESHPLYLGMLGMHAARYTNRILDDADLVIAAGVRFDDRATGKLEKFCPDAKIIHLDVDPAEINKNRIVDLSLVGDAKPILKRLLNEIENNSRKEWYDKVQELKLAFPLHTAIQDKKMHPVNIIRKVSSILSNAAVITTDVGQHQMWVAQTYPFNTPRTLLTSGGSGTMGFGLPSAIGAAVAKNLKGQKDRVVCFAGDGSLLMNIQELDTLAEENLNVTVILFNNRTLGLVRQQQELFFNKKYIACQFRTNPDFTAIASAFGIKAFTLDHESDIESVLDEALHTNGPSLVNILIDPDENVLPMVPPGGANSDMIG